MLRRVLLPPLIRGMQAVRCWDRDGSMNCMPLDSAVGAVMHARHWDRNLALDQLLSGAIIQVGSARIWAVPLCRRCGQDLVDHGEIVLEG